MLFNNKRKSIISVLSALALTVTAFALPVSASNLSGSEQSQINSYKEQQSELDKKIAESEKKIEAIQDDIANEQAYVDELNGQIANYQTKIDGLQNDIDELEGQIDEINGSIDGINDEIDGIKTDMAHNTRLMVDARHEIDDIAGNLNDSLRDVYINGSISPLEYLFACGDFSVYLIIAELSSNKAKHDNEVMDVITDDIAEIEECNVKNNELIDNLNEKTTELETQKSSLKANQDELNASKSTLEDAQGEIEKLESKTVQKIESLDKQSELYESMVADYEAQQRKLENEIDYIIAEAARRRAEEEAKKKAEQEAAASRGEEYTEDDNSNYEYSSSTGFIWPLRYSDVYVSSAYGYRTSPLTGTYSLHGGVDTCCWSGTQGKTVSATAGGIVIYSGFNGYGNCVIIDHGSGYTSLYGHMDSRSVYEGQYVSQGQTVGYAGNTYGSGGYSTGPHLHFEIRNNGTKVNPQNYCSP